MEQSTFAAVVEVTETIVVPVPVWEDDMVDWHVTPGLVDGLWLRRRLGDDRFLAYVVGGLIRPVRFDSP